MLCKWDLGGEKKKLLLLWDRPGEALWEFLDLTRESEQNSKNLCYFSHWHSRGERTLAEDPLFQQFDYFKCFYLLRLFIFFLKRPLHLKFRCVAACGL